VDPRRRALPRLGRHEPASRSPLRFHVHQARPTITWPSAGRRFLVIAGLTGFAISQPLLSILGDDPATLAFHGVQGGELIIIAGLIALVPPLVLWGAVTIAAIVDRRAGRILHLAAVAALVGLFAVQLAKSAGLEQPVLAAAAAAAGLTFSVAHVRVAPMATWAAYTAILPILAAAFFLLASPASALFSAVKATPDRVGGTRRDQPSVVLILLDELPTRSLIDDAGGIDRARFPNLAAFADEATWYRHHTSLAPLTLAAVPSLLSGTLPTNDPPLWTNHPDSLFTLLGPTHELEVFESVTSLCPYTSCDPTSTSSDGTHKALDVGRPGLGALLDVTVGLWFDRVSLGAPAPPALDDFVEDGAGSLDLSSASPPTESEDEEPFGGFSDEAMQATFAGARGLIDSLDASEGPSLYYLHLMLPHQPWGRQPDGELYGVADSVGITLPEADQTFRFSWSDWTAAVSEQRHLLQAQYSDQLVGQMMGALREEGLYDDSLVIVTSDHGIAFESRTRSREVAPSTIDAIAYSPLLIKAPGQRAGVVDDSNLMAIDLVPTIADILGLPIDWEVDGAPAGSAALDARGDSKMIYDLAGLSTVTLEEILEFSDTETFPSVPRGWIGPLSDPDDPLSALNDLLELDGVLGSRLDDLDVREGGGAEIERLPDLQRPPDDAVKARPRDGARPRCAQGRPAGDRRRRRRGGRLQALHRLRRARRPLLGAAAAGGARRRQRHPGRAGRGRRGPRARGGGGLAGAGVAAVGMPPSAGATPPSGRGGRFGRGLGVGRRLPSGGDVGQRFS